MNSIKQICRTSVPGFSDEELEWEPMSATLAAIRRRDAQQAAAVTLAETCQHVVDHAKGLDAWLICELREALDAWESANGR